MARALDALSPGKVSAAAFVGHFLWALWAGLSHPGLGYEPDRVANWLYFQTLISGAPRLGELWYFPAPKLLPVLLFGPFADGPVEIVVVALLAGVLAAAAAWIVASSFGAVAGAAVAVLLVFNPVWTRLVATASGDFFVAVGIVAAIVAWSMRRERLAAIAILLATLVKTPAAAAALPLLLDRERSMGAKAWLVLAAIAGFALTTAGNAILLGHADAPMGFLTAYTALRGTAAPPVHEFLGTWLVKDIGTELLPICWPLALVGLFATFMQSAARSMRQWFAASIAVAAAYVLLASSTKTLLFARFFWSLEVCILAFCAIGAIVVGHAVARVLAREAFAAAAGWTVAALLIVLTAVGPARNASSDAGRYTLLFEYGARTAIPWLEQARAEMAPGDRLVVPLWFQPAAMWKLRGQLDPLDVDAAEVLVARRSPDAKADWLLLAPAYVENGATRQWAHTLAGQGYETVAWSELPHMTLLRNAGRRTAVLP